MFFTVFCLFVFSVDRVQEAEKEVSQMLLKSIERHIQDAGKVLLKQDESKSILLKNFPK